MTTHPRDGIGAQLRTKVLVVCLVEHHDDARRDALQERFDRGRGEVGSGRVVGVRDVDQRRVLRNRRRHRFEVVAECACRNHDGSRAARLGRERVDRKRVLRVDAAAARRQHRRGGEFEDVVAAVAERDPVERHAELRRQGRLQRETVGVRVAAEVLHGRDHRLAGRLRHAERVLVRRELHDRGRIEPELARQFLDRLARLVGRDCPDVLGRRQFVHGIRRHRHSVIARPDTNPGTCRTRTPSAVRRAQPRPSGRRRGLQRRRRSSTPRCRRAPAATPGGTSTRCAPPAA